MTFLVKLFKLSACMLQSYEINSVHFASNHVLDIVSHFAVIAMEEAVGNHILDFLRKSVRGDIAVLVGASKLLCEYPRCIPVGDERARLCEVVIANIAEVPVPKPQSTQVSRLIKQV
jgi:hypothetical protein